jgi:hypothetical protein
MESRKRREGESIGKQPRVACRRARAFATERRRARRAAQAPIVKSGTHRRAPEPTLLCESEAWVPPWVCLGSSDNGHYLFPLGCIVQNISAGVAHHRLIPLCGGRRAARLARVLAALCDVLAEHLLAGDILYE